MGCLKGYNVINETRYKTTVKISVLKKLSSLITRFLLVKRDEYNITL